MMKRRLAIVFSFALLVCGGLALSASSAPKKSDAKHTVRIENMKFNPDKLEISAGDTVEWTNNDERDHNVTAKDKSFISDNLGSGETFKFTFKKAGKYPYVCTLHPRMKGTIIVGD
jgi:plastocyanin